MGSFKFRRKHAVLNVWAKEIFQHSPKMICISAALITDVEQIPRDYKCFVKRIDKLDSNHFRRQSIKRRTNCGENFPADFYAESFADLAKFTQKMDR
jgi:hypothetical protein